MLLEVDTPPRVERILKPVEIGTRSASNRLPETQASSRSGLKRPQLRGIVSDAVAQAMGSNHNSLINEHTRTLV